MDEWILLASNGYQRCVNGSLDDCKSTLNILFFEWRIRFYVYSSLSVRNGLSIDHPSNGLQLFVSITISFEFPCPSQSRSIWNKLADFQAAVRNNRVFLFISGVSWRHRVRKQFPRSAWRISRSFSRVTYMFCFVFSFTACNAWHRNNETKYMTTKYWHLQSWCKGAMYEFNVYI